MTRLSKEERESLVRVAEKVLKGREATSIAAYGSKVAGYARQDSDYDIIVSVKKFPQRVRYWYVEEPLRASALVVEDGLMSDDASKAYLGEFVVGRLLNVYEPITNGEFVRGVEVDYKRRVVAEALLELASEYGEFAQDLVIPMEYFLFDKLHKRAMIYPPALYSYVRTYTCEKSRENREVTVRGFEEASSSLAAQGIITLSDRRVRIVGERLKGNTLDRVLSLLNLTVRGVRQYAVHGYAGRVGFGVFKSEALSKLRRMRDGVEPPDELQNPRGLIGLEDGVVFDDVHDIVKRLAEMHSMKNAAHREETLGQVYSTTRLITLSGNREKKFVMKHFADIRAVKWAILGIWASGRNFSMSPQSRLHREYTALKGLREKGLDTPAIIGVSLKEKILVREFIEGRLLSDELEEILKSRRSDMTSIARYARALADVHRAGFAIGDSKGSNVILQGDRVYIADLEQSLQNGDMAWDVAEFLYYTAKLSRQEERMRLIADEFLKNYTQSNGREIVAKAKNPKYLAPFRPFLTQQMVRTIREIVAEYSS